MLRYVEMDVENQVFNPSSGFNHGFDDRLDVRGLAVGLGPCDSESDGERTRTGAVDILSNLLWSGEAARRAGHDLEGVPGVGRRTDGVGEEVARRLQRRTRAGVTGYRYRAYTADDLLREQLEMQVRRWWTVEIKRGGAGGRGGRCRLGGRDGELAHWRIPKTVNSSVSALARETSCTTRDKTYHDACRRELLEEAK